MDALAAARMGDEICHGTGILGMIAGAIVGAVVAVAVVAAVAATGGLALVIFAGAIAGGALAANQILKGVKTIFNLPDPTSGVLASGSLNVFTNSRPAVRATLDFAAGCSGGSFPFITHPTIPPWITIPVAEGSKTVTINSMLASRVTMMLVCSAKIKTGSQNVFIGGPTARTEFVWDITSWLETGFTWLGIGALIGAGVFAAMAGAAAFAGFVAITGGMMLAFEGLGMLGDMIGPGYRDLFQGIAGMGLLLASPKIAPKATNTKVVAELKVNGKTFRDTNQRALQRRVSRNTERPTAISGRVASKTAKEAAKAQRTGKPAKEFPNGNMKDAHAEIGSMQKAHEAGAIKGQDVTITVKGKEVCGHCMGDIPAMGRETGAKSVTVVDTEGNVIYKWDPSVKGGLDNAPKSPISLKD
jgi:uncharacterized Zn-binding protein involved in type VI secretion